MDDTSTLVERGGKFEDDFFEVKIVLLSRETGSVSRGNGVSRLTIGNAQLLRFSCHRKRGSLALIKLFYGQNPVTQLSPPLTQLVIVVVIFVKIP